jgi:ACS family tartrate transporter-like MFS transporter
MSEIERRTMSKVSWRLVPFLMLCYFIAYLDRVNLSFAGGPMSKDLGLTSAVFGGAAGMFFIAYFFFEVPSNIALDKVGARIWIARIMFTWGIIAGAEAFVQGTTSLYVVRILLGIAEAGFFPGIIFFLTLWFPAAYRARIVGLFMFAIPISTVIGAPISGALLNLDGAMGLHGWQWMFLVEAIPALLLSVVVFFYLTDRPRNANWLTDEERAWLNGRLEAEEATRARHGAMSWARAMFDPRVIALGVVYMGCNTPQYGLSFFLPQIVKAFGLSNLQAGFVTAIPYSVGAVAMIFWSRHSDSTGERKWHAILPLLAMVVGLLGSSITGDPTAKMAWLCIAGAGFFSVLPVFWTLPTAFLNVSGAAAGIAAVNSIGNLGGYFGPQVFGILKTNTGGDSASLIFLAACAAVGAVIVFVMGHNPALERPMEAARAAE